MPDGGSGNPLLQDDREFLAEKEYEIDIAVVGGALHVVIHEFELLAAYIPSRVDLLVILPAGYPNASPDMFWTDPAVRLANGASPHRADVYENYGNRRWQRWSRHRIQAWRPGIDGLRSHIGAIRRELAKGI